MRNLLGGVLCVGLLAGGAAWAEETGTRVEVRLASGTMPDPEKVVAALITVGSGERQVKVIRKRATGGETLTLDLWGGTVPEAEIPSTLRESFPALAPAEIQVSTLPLSEKPKLEAGEGEPSDDGKVIRKRIIRQTP